MPLYIFPLLALLVAVLYNFLERNKAAVSVALLPAFLFMGLLCINQSFGIDIPAYKIYFEQIIPDGFWKHHVEKGFGALMALVKVIGGDFNLFLFLINLLLFISLFRVFYRYSVYIALSWLIFYSLYYGYVTTILRQGVALAFTIYSIQYILNEQKNKYCFCVILAILFHYSSIIFLPAYWIAHRKPLSVKSAVLLIILFFPFVMVDMTPLFYKIAGIAGVPAGYIDLYLTVEGEAYERAGLSLGLFVKVLFFLIYAISYDKQSKLQCALYNIGLFYLLFYFPLSSISMLSARGLDYYKIFECITIPFALYNQKELALKILFGCVVIGYAFYATFENFKVFEHFNSLLNQIIG